MGVKLDLSFHLIPWYCFFNNNMGGHISCVHPHLSHDGNLYSGKTITAASRSTVKLIGSDGRVKVYNRPVVASELMVEFPKHLVCHADSFFIGKKVPPLCESDRLKLGHKYFLLPKEFFQSVLTFATIASFASLDGEDDVSNISSSKKKELVKKLSTTCKPFDIKKAPNGSLQIRVSDEFIAKLMEEGRVREHGEVEDGTDLEVNKVAGKKVCTTPQLQKDYTQLVELRRSIQWRPKLETIREKDRKKLKYAKFRLNIKRISKKNTHSSKSSADHSKKVKIGKVEKEEEKRLKSAKKLEMKMVKKERKNKKRLENKEKKLVKKLENQQKKQGRMIKLVHSSTIPAPPPPPKIRTFSKIKWKKKKKTKEEDEEQKKDQIISSKLVHGTVPPPPPPPPPPKIRTFSSKIKWKKKKKKEEEKERTIVHGIPAPPSIPTSSKMKWKKIKDQVVINLHRLQ